MRLGLLILCISVPILGCRKQFVFLVVLPFGSVLNHYLPNYKWTVVIQQIRREREYYMLLGLQFIWEDNEFLYSRTIWGDFFVSPVESWVVLKDIFKCKWSKESTKLGFIGKKIKMQGKAKSKSKIPWWKWYLLL